MLNGYVAHIVNLIRIHCFLAICTIKTLLVNSDVWNTGKAIQYMKRILIVCALMLCVITNSCESKPLNYIQFEEQETNAVTEKSIELEFNHELSYEVFPQNGLETRLSDGFELSYSSTDDIVVFISEYDGKTMFLYKNLNSGNILPICSDSVCTHKSGDECPACDISGITLFNYSYSDGTLYYATSVIDEAGMKEGYAVKSYRIDSNERRVLFSMQNYMSGMQLRDGELYFIESNNDTTNALYSYNLKSNKKKLVYDGAIDERHIESFVLTNYGIIYYCEAEDTLYLNNYSFNDERIVATKNIFRYACEDDMLFITGYPGTGGEIRVTSLKTLDARKYNIKDLRYYCIDENYIYYTVSSDEILGKYMDGFGVTRDFVKPAEGIIYRTKLDDSNGTEVVAQVYNASFVGQPVVLGNCLYIQYNQYSLDNNGMVCVEMGNYGSFAVVPLDGQGNVISFASYQNNFYEQE